MNTIARYLLICIFVTATAVFTRSASAQAYDYYLTGSSADVMVNSDGGYLLAGGGSDVDSGMRWMKNQTNGGDFVVIRASGSDGYNDYLFRQLSGQAVNSVETIVFNRRSASFDPFVINKIQNAEAVFMAGGDQADYYDYWRNTPVEDAINQHAANGTAVIGGTSAGLAVMGSSAFVALNGTVYSDEALDDPFNQYMTLSHDFLELPMLEGVITDSHFRVWDREGRMMGFLGRSITDPTSEAFQRGVARGIGIDERTAIAVEPNGTATVLGRSSSSVLLFETTELPLAVEVGEFLDLQNVRVTELTRNDVFNLNTFLPLPGTNVEAWTYGASGGQLTITSGFPEVPVIPEPAIPSCLSVLVCALFSRRRSRIPR